MPDDKMRVKTGELTADQTETIRREFQRSGARTRSSSKATGEVPTFYSNGKELCRFNG